MSAGVHPVFAGILAGIEAAPLQIADAKRAEYVKALKQHDWTYQWSDDGAKWRRGSESRKALVAMQPELDPDFAIWNQHCPERYRDGMCATS